MNLVPAASFAAAFCAFLSVSVASDATGDDPLPVYATDIGGLSFDGGRISPEFFTPGWGAVRQRGGKFLPDSPGGGTVATWSVLDATGDKPLFAGRAEWTPEPDGSVRGAVSLECRAPCRMKTVALSLETPVKPSVGEGDGSADLCSASLGGGRAISVSFGEPVAFHCQDESQWSGAWKTRFGGRLDDCAFSPGDRVEWRMSISVHGGVSLSRAEPVAIREGSGWVRMERTLDVEPGSALDFAALGLVDAPAGKHGWLRSVGNHFEFEGLPGVPQRFHGVNLCFTACFPDHATADLLVDRLVRSGYNSIRIHHHDGLWAESDENRERLDYLAARAVGAGLYLTTDLYVSRPVAWRDIGEDRDGNVPPARFKALIATHDGAFSNFCAYARAFLEHVNPYTGRAWKDEPGAPLLSLVNEGKPDEAVERAAFSRCAAFVRSLGCRALLTNDNNGQRHAPGEGATPLYDYVDNHIYVDHPHFPDRQWALPSRLDGSNPVTAGKPAILRRGWGADSRAKPFTATEWAFCGPSRRRGAGGLLVGALAAADGWDGLWRFAYAHDAARLRNDCRLGPGYFDATLDPVVAASDRAVACLFLRGDAAAAGGSLREDRASGSAAVESPLTCGGFAERGEVRAGPLRFEPQCPAAAALWVSSLDGVPLPQSGRMLLVHLTDAQGGGTRFSDATRKEIIAWGNGCLVQEGVAKVSLRLDEPDRYTVYALDSAGRRLGEITSSSAGGELRFRLSTAFGGIATIYAEIIADRPVGGGGTTASSD